MTEKPARVFPCPRCKKSTVYNVKSPFRPFCSEDCKNEDIISWANEDYRADGGPAEPEEILAELQNKSTD